MILNFTEYKFTKGEELKAILEDVKYDIEEIIKIFLDQNLSDNISVTHLRTISDIDTLSDFFYIHDIGCTEDLCNLYISVCDTYELILSDLDRFYRFVTST